MKEQVVLGKTAEREGFQAKGTIDLHLASIW